MNSDRQYEHTMELWRSYSIATSLELAAHLENFAILFSYNSGKIENREITYHDTHEIFKNGRVCGYTGDLRTLYEIKNLKDASELMYRWFDERKPITLDSIREMQFELTKDTYNERRWELGERPGEFKKNDLWGVGMHDVAAPVDEIEDDLQQDLDEVSEFGDENPLVAAAFWHARFEGVHAFADGNGRTGRAMMNYYLLLHNHPPIVIFDEDRKDYYAALDGFDMTGDLKPLIGFLRRETCKTWESAVQREDRSHQMSLEKKRDTVSRRVSLDEINNNFNAR